MYKYLGVNIIQATPERDFHDMPGYKVKAGGTDYWVPKMEFDKAYMMLAPDGAVTQGQINKFIKTMEVSTIGDKTTLVRAILVNDFEIIKTSSCVDASDYDALMGESVCVRQIKREVGYLLRFMTQCAICGIK